jgi:two-component system phosphate regulon sensor histidine kinase PhoR
MPNPFTGFKMPRALRTFVIGYLLLHLLAAVVFVWALTVSVRSLVIASSRQQMHAMAIMLNEHVNGLELKMNDPGLPEHVRQLGEKTRFRFTLINNQGTVIADSETGTRDIGYHGDRPEIMAATPKQAGFSERFSATLQIPMLYLAIPAGTDSTESEGHVRVAVPAGPINAAIRSAQEYFWTFAIVLGLITAVLMTLFAALITKPLSIFADAARRIGVGQFESFPSLLNRNDEWRSLADAYRNMQTELATREQRIVKNRDRLQAVLSSMVEGVVSVSPQCKVLIANRAACRMLNIAESQLRGRNLLEVVRAPELVAAVEKTQEERTFTITEFQISSFDHRRTISARVSVLPNETQVDEEPDETEPPGVVVVLQDVTELRQLENMRQNFVANVSHELKTPLASIKAYAETLKLGALNDKQRNLQFVEQIESQADFLNQQIQDLLQLARVESGQAALDIQRVNLNHECEQCVSRFAELARTNKIKLSLKGGEPPPLARADVEGLATVLNNLVTNALSYTPAGGEVCVSTYYDGNSAVAEVADTGIGIAVEHQSRIFERFYRVDKARSRDKGGTGLGLSIVKHLVLSFGGSVELESRPGKGTKFRICLPKFVA